MAERLVDVPRGSIVEGRARAHTAITCNAVTENGAHFDQTNAGDPPRLAIGACLPGYYVVAGAPYRGCNITGFFQPIQNPCQRTSSGWERGCVERRYAA